MTSYRIIDDPDHYPGDHWLGSVASFVEDYRERVAVQVKDRNAGIRRAYANGVTVAQLVKITNLSRAQVQRILDLSKDGA